MFKIRAGGVLFVAKDTERMLFVKRSKLCSHTNKWCYPGGKINPNETNIDGLLREMKEELGFMPPIVDYTVFDYYLSADKTFEYSSFFVLTPHEFIPKLNNENNGYCWCDIDSFPKPLHPSVFKLLKNQTLIHSFKDYIKNSQDICI